MGAAAGSATHQRQRASYRMAMAKSAATHESGWTSQAASPTLDGRPPLALATRSSPPSRIQASRAQAPDHAWSTILSVSRPGAGSKPIQKEMPRSINAQQTSMSASKTGAAAPMERSEDGIGSPDRKSVVEGK